MKSKLLFYLLSVSFIALFLYSCGTNSNGVFEKRKHLKGWHFNKKKKFNATSAEPRSKERLNKREKVNESGFAFHDSNQEIESNLVVKSNDYNSPSLENQKLIDIKPSDRAVANDFRKESKAKLKADNLELIGEKSALKSNSRNLNVSNKGESVSEDFNSSSDHWNFSSLFLLSFMAPLLIKGRKTRQLQHWAAKNQSKSRSLLVGLKLVLAGSTMGLGYLLQSPFYSPHLIASVAGIGLSYGLWEYFKSKDVLNSTRKIGLISALNTSTGFGFFTLGGMFSHSLQLSSWSINSGLMDLVPPTVEKEMIYSPFEIFIGIVMFTLFCFIVLAAITYLSCVLICSSLEAAGISLLIVGGYFTIVFFLYLITKLFRRVDSEEVWSFPKTMLVTLIIVTGIAFITLAISFLSI
ncbi:hypothetical protein ERX46_10400 [Brumimicrobium glaciale]|uniref:Uncharacterized protein n=1 Tax=Brumimicrobium glaciale TaxID=200475 RepID=A0A4Q4KLT8_9FLAO|nr:hypothetical protein [Brumimicrobium glaciale]RYM33344.1 hypothetical protein ERX46_10400 [Brumimicrobium glaciale]